MENIKEKIINALKTKGDGLKSSELSKIVNKSKVTILSYLKILEKEGVVIKFENGPQTWYLLNKNKDSFFKKGVSFWKIYNNKKLEEHIIFEDFEKNIINKIQLSDQAKSIFGFAFLEMVNNAIEHSGSKRIKIECLVQNKNIFCVIEDYGVGAFANVMKKVSVKTEVEAARELLKGKITTNEASHTGQGIFFTSRITDSFSLESHKNSIVINNNKDFSIINLKKRVRGTRVMFFIKLDSKKHITNIFNKYAEKDINGFNTTEVHIKLYSNADSLISRSQARRITANLEKFQKIILDFSGVKYIGQGFADEIFRVFKNKHPNIELVPINTDRDVDFMIRRSKAEK